MPFRSFSTTLKNGVPTIIRAHTAELYAQKMEDQVNRLVEKTWKKFQETPRSQRLMIAVSGIPGSGMFRRISVTFAMVVC